MAEAHFADKQLLNDSFEGIPEKLNHLPSKRDSLKVTITRKDLMQISISSRFRDFFEKHTVFIC